MPKRDRFITLKDAVIYSNHAEENIRLQIERGLLKKYDKNGTQLKNPLKVKGFFKLSELMAVYNIKDPEAGKERFLARKHRRDSVKDIIPSNFIVLQSSEMKKLAEIKDQSVDTWILFPKFTFKEKQDTSSYHNISNSSLIKEVYGYLEETLRILKSNGNVLIHSIPRYLPYFGVKLNHLGLYFKYWIVYSEEIPHVDVSRKYKSEANCILYYVKSPKKFRINRVRIPYRFCSFCNKPLKDYGGKKHLRHRNGMVLSDIWHPDFSSNQLITVNPLLSSVLKRLVDLSCTSTSTLLLAPYDGVNPYEF
ncbi:MAG: DNA methyltransferase [Promethearchaeota archaeon]